MNKRSTTRNYDPVEELIQRTGTGCPVNILDLSSIDREIRAIHDAGTRGEALQEAAKAVWQKYRALP